MHCSSKVKKKKNYFFITLLLALSLNKHFLFSLSLSLSLSGFSSFFFLPQFFFSLASRPVPSTPSSLSSLASSLIADLFHRPSSPTHPKPHCRSPQAPSPNPCLSLSQCLRPTPPPASTSLAQADPSPKSPINASDPCLRPVLRLDQCRPVLPTPSIHASDPRLCPVLRSDPRHLSILFAVIEFVCLFFFFF